MADRLRLEIELELTDPITGRLVADGERERRFTGWLELHAALDAACLDAHAGGEREPLPIPTRRS